MHFKNKYSKNHDSLSDRLRNSMSSIKTFYTGGGNKDQKEGFGINIWNDEAKYMGYYKNNKAEGYGKFMAGNDIYRGEFKDDAASGYGIFNNEVLTYEGFWVKDLQEKYGIENWKDGSIYKSIKCRMLLTSNPYHSASYNPIDSPSLFLHNTNRPAPESFCSFRQFPTFPLTNCQVNGLPLKITESFSNNFSSQIHVRSFTALIG